MGATMLGGGCGGAGRDDLVASYRRSHPDVDASTARCVVDALLATRTVSQVVGELGADSGPSAEFELDQFRAEFDCGLRDQTRADLEADLRAQGFDASGARCAAGRLVDELDLGDLDALLAGDMPDEFYADYVAALEDCDALN